jgi:hypothetical protein
MGNGEDNQWVLSGLSPSVGLHGKSFDLISPESGHLVGIIPFICTVAQIKEKFNINHVAAAYEKNPGHPPSNSEY